MVVDLHYHGIITGARVIIIPGICHPGLNTIQIYFGHSVAAVCKLFRVGERPTMTFNQSMYTAKVMGRSAVTYG